MTEPTAAAMRDDTHMADAPAPAMPAAAPTSAAATQAPPDATAPAVIAQQPPPAATEEAPPAVPASPPSEMHDATPPALSAAAASTSPVAASSAAATAASASASSSAAADAVSQLAALERVFHVYYRRMQMTPAHLGVPAAAPPPLTPDSLAAAFDSMQSELDAGYLREDTLAARCAAAHREVAQFEPFLASALSGLTQKHAHLRATFMDPSIDALLRKAQDEKKALQAEITELREFQQADGFVKDSVNGRRLLHKVKVLAKENEEYFAATLRAPSVIATEKALTAAQLELAPLKTQHAELLATYEEMESFLAELESDNRLLQTQLDEARAALNRAQQPTDPAAPAAAAPAYTAPAAAAAASTQPAASSMQQPAEQQQQHHPQHALHPQLHPALYFGAPATMQPSLYSQWDPTVACAQHQAQVHAQQMQQQMWQQAQLQQAQAQQQQQQPQPHM